MTTLNECKLIVFTLLNVFIYFYQTQTILFTINPLFVLSLMFSRITMFNQLIGLMGRVFANGPGDPGSIPGRVIPKTQKMVLDASLLYTQQYKVRIEGKVEQPR